MGWFLWPFLAHDLRFPLGPDAPVYLWWTRLAGEEGLSAVGQRAAVPALALVTQGALGRSVVESIAALEVVLGVAAGLASGALLRGRAPRMAWALAGLLGGTFAVHLAAGYLANLLQAVAFLAAAAALAERTQRGAWVGAGLLAVGGLAHPVFFLLGAAILLAAAGSSWRSDRQQAGRVAGSTMSSAALAGVGLLALVSGPSPLGVDTSRDAFLRRAGLGSELRGIFVDRFVQRWTRYVQWASVPLAAAALRRPDGFVGRLLVTWVAATALGIGVGLLTGWMPADRFVTFGFAVPVLAALGLASITSWPRPVAIPTVALLTLAMLAGSFIAWDRQEPFLSEDEVRAATIAGMQIERLAPGTPLAFQVGGPDASAAFLPTRAGNVIRAAVPPDRIRDVVVVVPPLEQGDPGPERRALERIGAEDVAEAERRSGREAVVFDLTPFGATGEREGAIVISPDPSAPVESSNGPLVPSSPGAIAISGVLVLALLWFAGYGWARAGIADPVTATALAPAAGAGALVLAGIALERLGVPIDGTIGAWVVSTIAGGGGYLVWSVLERLTIADPAP